MRIEESIEIRRSKGIVHEYVSNPLNDPEWCPKVLSVRATDDARSFDVVHRPVPLLPPRDLRLRIIRCGPDVVELEEQDSKDSFEVSYRLEELSPEATRMTQISVAEVAVPRIFHPIWRRGIARDVRNQLECLKEVLERIERPSEQR